MYVLAWHDNDTMHLIHAHFNEGCTNNHSILEQFDLNLGKLFFDNGLAIFLHLLWMF
jgi:hypothetical protein